MNDGVAPRKLLLKAIGICESMERSMLQHSLIPNCNGRDCQLPEYVGDTVVVYRDIVRDYLTAYGIANEFVLLREEPFGEILATNNCPGPTAARLFEYFQNRKFTRGKNLEIENVHYNICVSKGSVYGQTRDDRFHLSASRTNRVIVVVFTRISIFSLHRKRFTEMIENIKRLEGF
uniref:LisH domain-containing protein n=1 Tax=Caenorhabditis tropicalis TaxID=1561998 RepID=A0A1I7TI67_9PELO